MAGGAYLFGQREYDPRLGTFRSPDQGGSDQLYGYASGNPISRADPTGMDDILGDTAEVNGRLDKIRNISGAISTGALVVAVGCTLAVICAPLVPFAVGTAIVAGALSLAADTVLAVESCVAKGNCARAFMNVGLLALSRRVPGLRVGRGLKGCFRSFSGDTRVLMADGAAKPIRRVKRGDVVLAADPRTGERGPRTVTGVWVHGDTMVELEIGRATLTTTEDHPFWNATERKWQRADELEPGDYLLSAEGRPVAVSRVRTSSRRSAPAYNLSVNGLSTYHVFAESAPVLTHNVDGCIRASVAYQDWATKGAHLHIGKSEVRIFPDSQGGIGAEAIRLKAGTASQKDVQEVLDEIRSNPALRADIISKARSARASMNAGEFGMQTNRAAEMHFLIKALEKLNG